jgi:hypothetical protein
MRPVPVAFTQTMLVFQSAGPAIPPERHALRDGVGTGSKGMLSADKAIKKEGFPAWLIHAAA